MKFGSALGPQGNLYFVNAAHPRPKNTTRYSLHTNKHHI